MKTSRPRLKVLKCICRGNWRLIHSEYKDRIGKFCRDQNGREYAFVGILDGADDYYYTLVDQETGVASLLSCVGDLESSWGITGWRKSRVRQETKCSSSASSLASGVSS